MFNMVGGNAAHRYYRSPAINMRHLLHGKEGFVNSLKALMIVTFAEAISWLGLLLGMVMKYGFDNEQGVSIMGPVHGMLFMAFAVLLVMTHVQERWPIRKTVLAFLESIPPFLGFLLGKSLLDEIRRQDSVDPQPA
jgi:integral membrane protein